MKNSYQDLIEQTFDFPQEGFEVKENELFYYGIPLMDIIEQYGTPLKLSYLPKIGMQISRAKRMFNVAMAKVDYKGTYTYCYCTKSSHFSFVLEEVLRNDAHIETSSAYDIPLLKALYKEKKLTKEHYVICNGYKRPMYLQQITELLNEGFNAIPVLDNKKEIDYYEKHVKRGVCNVGIRIASEEEPSFQFYTSRLGIRYRDINNFYLEKIKNSKKFKLKMLHFFINTGIKDNAYYWSELLKCLNVYMELKKICPDLDSLNIGGGLPIKNSLGFGYDYEYMIEEIIGQIKEFCNRNNIEEPNIFTEFGTFTVGESGINIYSIIDEKIQNDIEAWYMIDNSFITTLPDSWAINQRYILLAINKWDKPFKRVNIGGLTCDSLDYYNSEAHVNQVFLPQNDEKDSEPLYIAFFNTGAYQESLSGFGGIKHCLIPSPKHVVIDIDENGEFSTKLFAKEQSFKSMLKILGYS
ncbi:MAG: arginine decarboxylase [Bacteroidetes bacterium]|nr:arginine decarboxylase [Bacteroidota bacterium]MBV6460765.1 Biosynthetic arginine decarboxylase [Flavobacteriales bacterium]WKZ75761.1 MAG: arginine decarboxylase [Vicingaceae bacterium]MCL4817301.1 arginine decarboxylase [Flavobacteriales bacterium]NOG94719.1 arginine decarboxylase [Bacteroidota bacterium]